MCYAALACVTDYDVWRETHDEVTAQMILDNLRLSVQNARKAVALTIETIPSERSCACACALRDALVTAPSHVSEATLEKLGPIIAEYIARAEAVDGSE